MKMYEHCFLCFSKNSSLNSLVSNKVIGVVIARARHLVAYVGNETLFVLNQLPCDENRLVILSVPECLHSLIGLT